ncbi:hypothetical protein NHP21011_15000 [Helicobacter heilmannii]|uniref:hypothetical protein n=1 Tax=Helicobacter heilmannii TaxID=35817 RepID=UPI00244D8451|nr:hypothetical protein [Helicobacter heilmannii]GMB95393.1 hypothetical protein NHP21011_15000 [Helicobacter heilmannii]
MQRQQYLHFIKEAQALSTPCLQCYGPDLKDLSIEIAKQELLSPSSEALVWASPASSFLGQDIRGDHA